MEVEEEVKALKAILGEENVFCDSLGRTISVCYTELLDGLQIAYTLPGEHEGAVGTCVLHTVNPLTHQAEHS